MDMDDVPQEGNATLNGERKIVYAKNAQGRLCITPSQGWEVEEIVTTQALSTLRDLSACARDRVHLGQASTLDYWMRERRMDEVLLAQSTGYWRWQVRRHLLPHHFSKLSRTKLQRYAIALGISVETLMSIPPR